MFIALLVLLPACGLLPGEQVQFDAEGDVPVFPLPEGSPLTPYIALLQHPERAWGGRAQAPQGRAAFDFAENPSLPKPLVAVRADLERMLTTYAPRLWWHPADPYPPMDPMAFLRGSSLWFRHDWGGDELVAAKGAVNAFELGRRNTGLYARRAHTLWWAREPAFAPTSFTPMTRPFESRGIEGGDEGFYLKLEDPTLSTGVARNWWTAKLGDDIYTEPFPQGRIPMFWKWGISPVVTHKLGHVPQRHARILIEYWYHLAFSHATSIYLGNHQGEWESVAMVIDIGIDADGRFTHTLRTAFYAAHEYGTWYCPDELTWTDAAADSSARHPEAFTSLGKHATYNAAGSLGMAPFDDITGRGRQWDTWKLLRPMALEPYYGYSGGWGEATYVSFMSGPLVPGPTFKILPKRAPLGEDKILADVRNRCGL